MAVQPGLVCEPPCGSESALVGTRCHVSDELQGGVGFVHLCRMSRAVKASSPQGKARQGKARRDHREHQGGGLAGWLDQLTRVHWLPELCPEFGNNQWLTSARIPNPAHTCAATPRSHSALCLASGRTLSAVVLYRCMCRAVLRPLQSSATGRRSNSSCRDAPGWLGLLL